ncbi:MAG: response regulator [SAR324 cluster bacterium]|nr:response regulator [SAR324 cluster bacterium]
MAQKLILLVEAEPSIVNRVEDCLTSSDYDFFNAIDGAEGIRKVFEIYPDLIIVDLALPLMSGIQLVRTLNFLKLQVPVIFIGEHSEFTKNKVKLPHVKDTCVNHMISEELEAKVEAVLNDPRGFEDIKLELEPEEFLGFLSREDRKKILIASDGPTARNLFNQLDTLGYYELYIATDGREALFKAISIQPDLIIASTDLTILEGKKLAKLLYILGHSLPLIFMQLNQDPITQEQLSKLEGVVGFWSTGQALNERKFLFDEVQKAVSLNARMLKNLNNAYKEIDTMNLKAGMGSNDILDDPTLFQEFDDVDLD